MSAESPPLKVCEMCDREFEKLFRYHAYLSDTIDICKDCLDDLRSTQPPKAEP